MAHHRIDEETRNVLIASVAAWAVVVAGAVFEDAFAKFDPRSVAYFAAAVALYALAAYRMDRGTRAFILDLSRGTVLVAACLTVATLVTASLEHLAALAVFMAPLAAVACAATFEKLTTRPTKAPGKSPVGHRAAI
jgi:hypothetical protein